MSIVLTVRILATLSTIATTFIAVVAAPRHGLTTGWTWWAIGSAAVLLTVTFLYGLLRVPREQTPP
ncbi:hypothetical protein GCM10023197_22750 [Gordonia humi]